MELKVSEFGQRFARGEIRLPRERTDARLTFTSRLPFSPVRRKLPL
jgi:hypothetical protein